MKTDKNTEKYLPYIKTWADVKIGGGQYLYVGDEEYGCFNDPIQARTGRLYRKTYTLPPPHTFNAVWYDIGKTSNIGYSTLLPRHRFISLEDYRRLSP